MTKDRSAIVQALLAQQTKVAKPFPAAAAVPTFVETSLRALFPQLSSSDGMRPVDLARTLDELQACLTQLCGPVVNGEAQLSSIVDSYMQQLPTFQALLLQDAEAIFRGDPAAKSVDEVILAYPGFLAIGVYRFAHWMSLQAIPIVPRMISEYAHSRTGIEIHPGAMIGEHFVIDHGTGIVIGETTIIGDNVKIYQGVTLGALSVDKSLANKKRHPTIERDVVIYANATILGGETIIGAGSVIGGNVWLTESVPPGSRIYHRPS